MLPPSGSMLMDFGPGDRRAYCFAYLKGGLVMTGLPLVGWPSQIGPDWIGNESLNCVQTQGGDGVGTRCGTGTGSKQPATTNVRGLNARFLVSRPDTSFTRPRSSSARRQLGRSGYLPEGWNSPNDAIYGPCSRTSHMYHSEFAALTDAVDSTSSRRYCCSCARVHRTPLSPAFRGPGIATVFGPPSNITTSHTFLYQ